MSDNNYIHTDKHTLQKTLRDNVVTVTFTKKDGSVRKIKCTLMEQIIVPYEKKTDRVRHVTDNIIPVWDIEAQGWRSININTIQSVNIGDQ